MNLTAIDSENPNLFFLAVVDTIFCFAMPGTGIYSLALADADSPLAKLPPPPPVPRSSPINAIRSGHLGSQAVLIAVTDSGHVVIHFTASLLSPLPQQNSQPPVILTNNSHSTWGITIYSSLQLVAVSANSHAITVFDMKSHSLITSSSDSTPKTSEFPLGFKKIRRELIGHTNNIPNIEFSSCGRFLASCSIDATVRIWVLETGQQLALIRNSSLDAWNWSVNFVHPETFRIVPDSRLEHSHRHSFNHTFSTSNHTYDKIAWSCGVPDCLKRGTLRDSGAEKFPLLTTTVLFDPQESENDDATVYSFIEYDEYDILNEGVEQQVETNDKNDRNDFDQRSEECNPFFDALTRSNSIYFNNSEEGMLTPREGFSSLDPDEQREAELESILMSNTRREILESFTFDEEANVPIQTHDNDINIVMVESGDTSGSEFDAHNGLHTSNLEDEIRSENSVSREENFQRSPLYVSESVYFDASETGDPDMYYEATEATDEGGNFDNSNFILEDDSSPETGSDTSSIDADEFWQRDPADFEYPGSISIEVMNLESEAFDAFTKSAGFVLYASLTDVYIVDLKTARVVCACQNLFERLHFGRLQIFDRISIHQYVPELNIIIVMSQAGAIAVIQLIREAKRNFTEDVEMEFKMVVDRIITPEEPIAYVGMFVKKRRNSSTGMYWVEVFAFTYNAKVYIYDIRSDSPDKLSVDHLLL